MKLKFKQRIFIYFFIIVAIFAISIVVIQQKEERKHRTNELVSVLRNYAEITNNYITLHEDYSIEDLNEIVKILPNEIRLSVIDIEGNNIYDKDLDKINSSDNHLNRPEILAAEYRGEGYNIRLSSSTHREYIYYAKQYPNYYLRIALPYTLKTQSLIEADNYFIYTVIILFIIVLILINYVANYFGKTITQLRNISSRIIHNQALPQNIKLPNNELGEIGGELIEMVQYKEETNKTTKLEREKLVRHFNFLKEGFAFFDNKMQPLHVNTHFISHINYISSKPILDVTDIFKISEFDKVNQFIQNKRGNEEHSIFIIQSNERIFQFTIILYHDGSFEILIKDVTKFEKTRILKQEMTSNIAHELRTPVAVLRGYLETLCTSDIPDDKRNSFIQKSYDQSIRLSTLIEDISLISKIEESASNFPKTEINILNILDEVQIDLTDKIKESGVSLSLNIDKNLKIKGNHTLIYSIFSNLIDNAIAYNKESVKINISCYLEDDNYVYFSVYDDGIGIDSEHLNRLFERFYRVNIGRTRNSGGTGLGLSIVRNSVSYHQGEIQAKNRPEGGLQFLFSLKK